MVIIKSFRINAKIILVTAACLCIIICIAALLLSGQKDGIDPGTALLDEKDEAVSTEKNDLTVFLTVAQEQKMIEVFDVKLERIAKKVSMDPFYQQTAESFLGSISGIYTKVNALPITGIIVRLPLEPAVSVRNKWFTGNVNEVFILFPENEKPYLLVLNERNQPLFFNFEGNTENLLNSLNYIPEQMNTPNATK